MDTKYQSEDNAQEMPEGPPTYQPYPGNHQVMYPPQHQALSPQVMYPPQHQAFSPQVIYPPQYPPLQPVPAGPSQVIYNPQYVQAPPQQTDHMTTLKHITLHYRLGIFFVCIGIVTCILEPLIPLLIAYPHWLFPAGIFMIISGSTSISGSKQNMTSHLVVSMVFDIFAAINLFSGLIAAIIVVSIPFYYFQKGFAIFQIIYCGILFCVVVWDSSLKCSDTCCGNKRPRPQLQNTVYVYAVQSPPQVVIR